MYNISNENPCEVACKYSCVPFAKGRVFSFLRLPFRLISPLLPTPPPPTNHLHRDDHAWQRSIILIITLQRIQEVHPSSLLI